MVHPMVALAARQAKQANVRLLSLAVVDAMVDGLYTFIMCIVLFIHKMNALKLLTRIIME